MLCLLGLSSPLAADGLVTGFLKGQTEKAKRQRVEADGKTIAAALEMYKLTTGDYPTDKQGLIALVEKPTEAPVPKRWMRFMDKVPRDAWNREYRLVVRTKNEKQVLVILSDGPDAEALTDDIEMPVEKPEPKPEAK
ncbi:type II secretion system major pseudopilin GspG [Luteolibacter arcticus]|uniref:Type II secretion system major pseudopilin GspG n=1 Tax=Luteolibacter arcticus TaxID=1581411 RepID=A0ABT3GLR4_9BACT|nr:type II secretion system major pseudopilin GspG [Luteolibacter arcticus]